MATPQGKEFYGLPRLCYARSRNDNVRLVCDRDCKLQQIDFYDKQYYRFSFACSEEQIIDGIKRIERYVLGL